MEPTAAPGNVAAVAAVETAAALMGLVQIPRC